MRKDIGIAVVGSGRIGSIRTRQALSHPAVTFVGVSDLNPDHARALADGSGAQFHTADNAEVIAREEVDAVIVSTPEGEHLKPILQAIELGKPVLVEKPIALSITDADCIIAAADTVMSRPNRDLLSECFPQVPIHGDIGECTSLQSSDKARRLFGYVPRHSWRVRC